MRLHYKFVTSHFDDDESAPHSLRRHYTALMEDLRRQSAHASLPRRSTQWRPPADIHETADAILVKMELAGVREEDLTITLYEDALVVTGRRDDDLNPAEQVCYHEAQIRYGPFRAEIRLPGRVRREGVEATYANGFVRVVLPKAAAVTSDAKATRDASVSRASKATQPLQAAQLGAWHVSPLAPETDGRASDESEFTTISSVTLAGLSEPPRRANNVPRGDLPDA